MPARVLVADDSPTIRRRATTTLSEAGYDVTCVEDGLAAWNLLQAETFTVLLADILMPGIDGYELCRRVKADERIGSLPVLLLRGTFEPWDQVKAVDAGADGYVTKPFDAEALLSTLGEVLADIATTSSGASSPAPGASASDPGMDASEPDLPGPDTAVLSDPLPELAEAPLLDSADDAAEPVLDLLEPEPANAGFDVLEVADAPPPETDEPAAPLAALASSAPPALDVGDDPFGSPEPSDASPFEAPAQPLGGAPFQSAPADPVGADDPFGSFPVEPAPADPLDPLAELAPAMPAAPVFGAPAPASPRLAVAPGGGGDWDDAMIERLAERVAARLIGRDLEKIAWEVVPDVAEAIIRKRLSEIEAQLGEE